MSMRKLTAGDGYSYLTRQVAANDATERGHSSLADYYEEKGESPGSWIGSGLASLDLSAGAVVTAPQMASLFGQGHHPKAAEIEVAMARRGRPPTEIAKAVTLGRKFPIKSGASAFSTRLAEAFTAFNAEHGQKWNSPICPENRARIRTEIGSEMFAEAHGRPPQDARELSGFIAKASRQATTAIAGFDLSFSPVKSVSALWALAPGPVAVQIRAAHDAAVADTLHWLEREVAYTRVGRAGARQVKVLGLVAASFTHRDSRAGDPDLHTHVAVSNKVQSEDGRWLALDGRLLYAAKVAASEHYNTRIEAELVERIGVEFVERDPDTGGKRPVREIRGVSTTLTQVWSRRRADIKARQSELAVKFQRTYGRPPTAIEALWQSDQATLETRAPKHEPRSERDQRDIWRAEADEVLGNPAEVDEMYARAIARGVAGRRWNRDWVEETAAAVVEAVEESRATWNVWHLTAEAQRQARRAGIVRADVEKAIGLVIEAAISRSVRLGVDDPVAEPAPLRRSDGESVYDVHGGTLYTSARVLSAEQEILSLAARSSAHKLEGVRVEVTLTSSAALGLELNEAQAAMVRDLATSGSLVQLALAPAGTGKTTAMKVLAEAWTQGGGHVIGLAPSAQAAHELRHAITGHTDTLAKLTWSVANEASAAWLRWICDIGPKSLVIIDEAGQAATTELASAIRFITNRGGAVRLIGDDQQLAAVGAGGVLRDIQQQYGASTLSEIRRFHDPAEAAATLAVREGDAAALGFYADNARIRVGDLGAVAEQAYDAWAADRAAGLDSVLLAPTRELVSQLNVRARAERLLPLTADNREISLADGNRVSAGDTIVTRRNNRRLVLSRSNWVRNGDRWLVEKVTPEDALVVRHLGLGRTLELPAAYVAKHVQLGYAATVHGAQGMTVDTGHLVATGEETRQTLYVGISRGRAGNHIYLATGCDGDPHSVIDPKALRPPTAIDVLTTVLDRDGSDRSATTTQGEAESYATQLHDATLRYHDALAFAAEHTLGPEALSRMEREAEVLWPGLTSEPAYPKLRAQLCLRALDRGDALTVLMDAAAERELGTSQDRAAVLDWRLGRASTPGPLPWLEPVPNRLKHDPTWGTYLDQRARRVESLAAAVRKEATSWSPASAPAWAVSFAAPEYAELRADLATWRGAFAIPDVERRPTGPAQPDYSASAHQEKLNLQAKQVVGAHRADDELIERLPQAVQSDPEFTRLSERIGALQAAQINIAGLLASALEQDHPLPDERAADALWWRIVRHLGPAALQASPSQVHTLRPAWSTYLRERLGEATGERVMVDAMWPALVAAVNARPAEWSAEQLIDAATEGRGPCVRPEELCSALVWRIATMTDAPFDEREPIEPELELDMGFRSAKPAPTEAHVTSVDRIIELNEWALNHFETMFPRSWAPDYVRDRLGTDLSCDSRFSVGYAPPGPTSLLQNLTARGARVEELVDAGLARSTERGRVVDAFRDRLVFPIYSSTDLVGFVGRRNPTKSESQFSGPKYLNTRSTAAFAKGEQLFGLTEGGTEVNAGATPVLVEGPMDAIAVTLAADGAYIGIAPLGTAFTQDQANKLKPFVTADPDNVIIATDQDSAGWESARRTFWRLAELRVNPRHVLLPNDADPADILSAEGPAALKRRLETSKEFGFELVEGLIEARLPGQTDAFSRVDLARAAARIIGALPPNSWLEAGRELATRLDLSLVTVLEEICDSGSRWTDDPRGCVARELAAIRPGPFQVVRSRAPEPGRIHVPARVLAAVDVDRAPRAGGHR